jgi:hypothetical protein
MTCSVREAALRHRHDPDLQLRAIQVNMGHNDLSAATLASLRSKLALPARSFNLPVMELIYPINFVGHDEWLNSGYSVELSSGDVITRDGEVLGGWRVADYNPEADDEGGRYEFVADGHEQPMFAEAFAFLDHRSSRGLALSTLSRTIREWHEAQDIKTR